MTRIEQIKAEIERLDDEYRTLRVEGTIQQAKEADLVVHVLHQLNNFVENIEKEQPQGLDEAAEEYCLATDMESQYVRRIKAVAFKTGAKWEKEKIIKKACAYLEPVFKNYAGYNCGADELVSFENVMNED